MQEYRFDRFRRGRHMAEGAKVHAENLEEAKKKAAKLFYEPGDEFYPWYPDEFRLRTDAASTSTTGA
jgi:hypothetical protein